MKDTRNYLNEIKEDMREFVLDKYQDFFDCLIEEKIPMTNQDVLRDEMIEYLQENEFTFIDNYCIYYHDCFEIVNNLRTFTSFEDCPIGLEITNIQQLAFSMLHAEITNDGTIYDVIDEILEEAKEKRQKAFSC